MRAILATSFVCALSISAQAKPTIYPQDKFLGDRWLSVAQSGASAEDVGRAMTCPPPRICRAERRRHKVRRWKSSAPVGLKKRVVIVMPAPMPVRAIVPLPRVRPMGAPEPDEHDAALNAVWNRIAVSLHTLEAPRHLRPVRKNLFQGFVEEIERALPRRGVSLAGVVPELVTLANRLAVKCGSRVISARVGRERSRVRGSGRPSLHRTGHAIDVSGNPSCMYALLRGFPGGVSNDYARISPPHIHISFKRESGEWGRRFAHYRSGVKRTRYARHRGTQRYASAR